MQIALFLAVSADGLAIISSRQRKKNSESLMESITSPKRISIALTAGPRKASPLGQKIHLPGSRPMWGDGLRSRKRATLWTAPDTHPSRSTSNVRGRYPRGYGISMGTLDE